MNRIKIHDSVIFDCNFGIVKALYRNEDCEIIAVDVYVWTEQLLYEEVPIDKVTQINSIKL